MQTVESIFVRGGRLGIAQWARGIWRFELQQILILIKNTENLGSNYVGNVKSKYCVGLYAIFDGHVI